MITKSILRLPGVEPGSIAWKAIILTVGLQTLTAGQIIAKVSLINLQLRHLLKQISLLLTLFSVHNFAYTFQLYLEITGTALEFETHS